MKTPLFFLIFFLPGCAPKKPATEDVMNTESIQGKWTVIQLVGPDGKGYEGKDVFITIKDNVAFQGQNQLKLEFVANSNTMKLFTKNNEIEQQVAEVIVTITTEKPTQMLWADKNSQQETLLEKVE